MSLKNDDLRGMILDKISIDEFEPKAGETKNVIVVAFYLSDEDPAEDLNTFIQRGFIDTIDVEVSPSTDEDGNYLVFVEMERNDTFPNKFQALLKDIENVTGKMDWKIKTYLSGDVVFNLNDPELFNYLVVDPEKYVTKDKFKMDDMKESIEEFLKSSLISHLTIDGNIVTLSGNRSTIVTEVIDVGDYDTVIGRNFLSESAFKIDKNPHEARVLERMLGDYHILPIGEYLCVNRDDRVMLLKNTELNYRT